MMKNPVGCDCDWPPHLRERKIAEFRKIMKLAQVGVIFLLVSIPAGVIAQGFVVGTGAKSRNSPYLHADQFCLWNRTGLPPEQQSICREWDKSHPPKAQDWKKFVSNNGTVLLVDLNSVNRGPDGRIDAMVYRDDGGAYNPEHLERVIFDCLGHFSTFSDPRWSSAPPFSLIGTISKIVCKNR